MSDLHFEILHACQPNPPPHPPLADIHTCFPIIASNGLPSSFHFNRTMYLAGVGLGQQSDFRGARGRLPGNGQLVRGVAVRKQTHYPRGHHLHGAPASTQSITLGGNPLVCGPALCWMKQPYITWIQYRRPWSDTRVRWRRRLGLSPLSWSGCVFSKVHKK